MATRRRSSKVIWMRSGWSSGSICWVLLVSGRFAVSQTIIPEAQEHFLTPSAHRDTHIFGGLGFKTRAVLWPGGGSVLPAPLGLAVPQSREWQRRRWLVASSGGQVLETGFRQTLTVRIE